MINTKHVEIRPAIRSDVAMIVEMLADDPLGQKRENYVLPLPASYYEAFELIDQDPQHELMVLEYQNEVIGTMQLSFIPYLTYQGGTRAQIEAVRIRKDYRGQGIGELMGGDKNNFPKLALKLVYL